MMGRDQIMAQVTAFLEEITDIPQSEMREDSILMRDLDLSSLEVHSLTSKLEKAYHLRISSQAVRGFSRIRDIVDYLESAIS